jgi:hypothetical protein
MRDLAITPPVGAEGLSISGWCTSIFGTPVASPYAIPMREAAILFQIILPKKV